MRTYATSVLDLITGSLDAMRTDTSYKFRYPFDAQSCIPTSWCGVEAAYHVANVKEPVRYRSPVRAKQHFRVMSHPAMTRPPGSRLVTCLCSSGVRAPARQAGGHGFKSRHRRGALELSGKLASLSRRRSRVQIPYALPCPRSRSGGVVNRADGLPARHDRHKSLWIQRIGRRPPKAEIAGSNPARDTKPPTKPAPPRPDGGFMLSWSSGL